MQGTSQVKLIDTGRNNVIHCELLRLQVCASTLLMPQNTQLSNQMSRAFTCPICLDPLNEPCVYVIAYLLC